MRHHLAFDDFDAQIAWPPSTQPSLTSREPVPQWKARRVTRLYLTAESRQLLELWVQSGTTPQRVATRARIVLLAGDGHSCRGIARMLGVTVRTVALWHRRYGAQGPQGLLRDAPGRGRIPTITRGENVGRVLALVEAPLPAGEHWTIRRLAEATGISRASIHRILRANGRTLRRCDSNVTGRND
jgi:transposase